jgi:hypothetical protein
MAAAKGARTVDFIFTGVCCFLERAITKISPQPQKNQRVIISLIYVTASRPNYPCVLILASPHIVDVNKGQQYRNMVVRVYPRDAACGQFMSQIIPSSENKLHESGRIPAQRPRNRPILKANHARDLPFPILLVVSYAIPDRRDQPSTAVFGSLDRKTASNASTAMQALHGI